MPNWPHKVSLKTSSSSNQTSSQPSVSNHGFSLLSIPNENLTHITCYLDPPSLFILSLVHRALYDHVKEEHTWHRAFLFKFLGISPESDVDDARQGILFRRSESSWRREYVIRFNLLRRWERSNSRTLITHSPVHSPISTMHLMQHSNSLLCSSLQYGIVSRSIPLTGKVIKGFLSPSSSGTGLGIGNPNTEFSPSVSACALASDGGTAKIVFGLRNGEIAVMTAARTMDTGTRSAARLVRCKVDEQHEGEVTAVQWDENNSFIVSVGRDGRIKIWDAKKVRCLWVSPFFYPESCVSVALRGSSHGFTVVSTMESGEIWIWAQIALSPDGPLSIASAPVKLPCPVVDEDPHSDISRAPSSLHVDNTASSTGIYAFVTYSSRSTFWGLFFEYTSSTYTVVTYHSDEASGPVRCLLPCLSNSSNERGFVIAGHQHGWLNVYPHQASTTQAVQIAPTRKFEAHLDGSAVTALAWNGIVLITGAANGATTVFDAITFARLRVLNSPVHPSRIRGIGIGANGQVVPGDVKQIILGNDRDFVVVSVGDRALAFKADAVPRHGSGKKKMSASGKKKTRGTVMAKGHEKLLLDQLITESIDEHDQESKHLRKVYGREREHREHLDRLGLDEVEALEYVLMLSRDEAHIIDDGVFEGDFDDIPTTPSSDSSSSPTPSSSKGKKEKQKSPRRRKADDLHSPSASAVDDGTFPSIKATPSPPSRSLPTASPSSSSGGSPGKIPKGAWVKPISPSSSGGGGSPAHIASSSRARYRGSSEEAEMDDDLKLAIQLSLKSAEDEAARRRV